MRDSEEQVILIDSSDTPIGVADKLEAHETGVLHRAFSVFVVNSRGELLLQRRAPGKYHGAGLWSNSACGHPRPGESTEDAARRRLEEEMGISAAPAHLFAFTYRADMGNGLVEHEIDHVFIARSDAAPSPDPTEADAWRWASTRAVLHELGDDPDRFTPWFAPALSGLLRHEHGAAGAPTT